MKKEIIFNDEQFDEFFDYNKNMFCYDKRRVKEIMDCNGYIKSELKTLVDEAEELFKKPNNEIYNSESMIKIYHAFQALKKSHPEFNK